MLLSVVLLITWVLIQINSWKANGQSVWLKKLPEKKLVTANSVFVYVLKDSLRTLKPFFYYIISHYNTQNKKALFGEEFFILFQTPHSCRHAFLQVKVQPASEKQAAGILSWGCEAPQWVLTYKVRTAHSQNTHLMSQKFKYIQISWNNCKWPLQLCAGKAHSKEKDSKQLCIAHKYQSRSWYFVLIPLWCLKITILLLWLEKQLSQVKYHGMWLNENGSNNLSLGSVLTCFAKSI